MKLKSMITTVFMAVFLCLSTGCTMLQTTAEKVADVVNENSFLVNVGTRTAVEYYINQKDTLASRIDRAKDVQARFQLCLAYIDENPSASINTILEVVDSVIEWDKLSPNERIIVQEIVHQVELELKTEVDKGGLEDDTRIAIRSLFEVAISAAKVYLLGV